MPKEILNEQIDVIENKIHNLSPVLLKILLKDNSTKENLRWATNTYAKYGEWYLPERHMNPELLIGPNINLLTPRVSKTQEEQQARTKDKGEVFTPAWMCNKQVNFIDEDWFGRKNVFNFEIENGWKTNNRKITFSKKLAKTWQDYVTDIRMEITCGEAPYLVSRYDVVKGEVIPAKNRIGILDRKLRIINENIDDEAEWFEWADKAYKATYGYDYQGDNVLIARENLLYTLIDNYQFKFNKPQPDIKTLQHFATIISWNIWQMDGLKYTIPYSEKEKEEIQISLIEWNDGTENEQTKEPIDARIKNWNSDKTIKLKELFGGKKMKFNYIIGNPPYNKTAQLTSTSDDPIYHIFMDETYKLSNKVELITPARYLMNAGKTPEAWNKKMLNDNHFKILYYEPDSFKVFDKASIPGGICVSYRDNTKEFKPIGLFIDKKELKSINNKVISFNQESIKDIISTQNKFNLNNLYKDFPKLKNVIGSDGKDKRFRQIIMERLPEVFTKDFTRTSIRVLGLIDKKRDYRYIERKYVEEDVLLDKYKVFVPFSNGDILNDKNPAYVIGQPVLGFPKDAITQTFICFGPFDTEDEASNLDKYLKTKFTRILLSILKVTQGNKSETWEYVPLQNFTNKSDIDWSKTIKEIDQQLFKKYALSEDEINFIETHVKEMK